MSHESQDCLVLLIIFPPVPGPALDCSWCSMNVVNELMKGLVFVTKRNHCITDILSFFGWGWPAGQQYLLNL